MALLPGVIEVPTIRLGAGVVTKRVMEAADAAGCVRGRPDLGGRFDHRRQRVDERGRQKAVLWGTALDNLVVVAHGHAGNADWIEVTRLNDNRGKIRHVPSATFEIRRFARRRQNAERLAGNSPHPRQPLPQDWAGQGRHRQILAGLPGIPEGRLRMAGSPRDAPPSCTGRPCNTRTVRLESCCDALEATPRLLE